MHPHQWLRVVLHQAILLLTTASLLGLAPVQAMAPLQEAQAPAAPAQEDARAKIDPELLATLRGAGETEYFIWMTEQADLSAAAQFETKQAKGAYVFATLRATAERSQQPLRAELDALGIRYQPFYIANKLFVYAGNERTALAIAARPDVARLTPNRHFQLPKVKVDPSAPRSATAIEPNLRFMRADQVWAMGIDGAGMVLAGNDTGLQWDHPAIIAQYRGWNGVVADHNYNWWDATGLYPAAPADGGLHGTHTTGTMVGSDGDANQIGVAPGAKTIHCKSMTNEGGGNELTFTTCFQWNLAPWDLNGNNPRPDLAPDAVNNSWGFWGGGDPAFADEINALQAAGIVVAVAAGNEGPFCGSLRSPGDYPQVLTIGAVNHASGSLPGVIASFSSRGPSWLDTTSFVPDILAPGQNIRSSVPNGAYEGGWSGTSMAAPHVAGLIGLMWSANPALQGHVEQTHALIQQTAAPLTGQTASNCGGNYATGPNNDWGYGAIDAYAAVEAALAFGATGVLTGTVTSSESGEPIAGARVEIVGADWTFTAFTSAAGVYTRRLPAGVYALTITRYGFLPVTDAAVMIAAEGVTTRSAALAPAPRYRVTGRVTDKNSGWPLYASIAIDGYPGAPLWTDPATGAYEVELVGGMNFSFHVNAWMDGYLETVRGVGPLTANRTVDVALDADTLQCSAPGYVSTAHEIYRRDFEMQPDGFQFSGATSWERGVPTTGPGVAHSGFNVWATNLGGSYFDYEDGYLTSAAIDLSGYRGRNVRLRWWEWLSTEACCDVAEVEGSSDGGVTWNRLYTGRGAAAMDWTARTVWLDARYANANFRIRFHFKSDYSIVAPGWYIDDVSLSDVTCRAPQGGGLVVGNVVDEITGAGLDGAVIQNMDVHATTTTAAGPAGAGFYTFHSPAGVKALRASLPRYNPESALVTVAANNTVRHDYALKSGRPAVTPGELNAAVAMGQTDTVTLTVENQGAGAFAYTLYELPAGFDPARAGSRAVGDPLFTVDIQATTGHQHLLGLEWAKGSWWVTSAGETSYSDPNYFFQLDKDGAVLNRWEQPNSSDAGWSDLAYDGEYLYAAEAERIVQVDLRTGAPTGVTTPCPLPFCRALAYDPATDHFWTADLSSRLVEFDRSGAVINRFDNQILILGATWDAWSPGGPYLWVWSVDRFPEPRASQIDPRTGAPTGVTIDGITLPGPYNIAGGGALLVDHPAFAGQVVLAGLHQATTDVIVGYDLGAPVNYDVGWLHLQPVSGTVAAGASQVVQVTFDAATPAGNQPGIQRALLVLASDTPSGSLSMPVELRVTATATAGKVQGAVTSLGDCDSTPAPLRAAMITLRSASGVTLTTHTNSLGAFGGWVDAGDSPYTVVATHADHLPAQLDGVAASAGSVVTANLALRLRAPCIIPDPVALTTTVPYGGKASAQFTLRNSGAAAGQYSLGESDLGFRSITATQRSLLHGGGVAHVVDEPKPGEQPAAPPAALRSSGGPDEFGYVFADSNDAQGPAYAWIEIAPPEGGDGIELSALNYVDDGYFYPLDLPFLFNFYGVDYDAVAVSSNGAIYFEDKYFSLVNLPIPDPSSPVPAFIAPFWDDLVIYPGAIYYKDLGDRLIIEYYQVSGCCISAEPGAWQVILFANGSILFQYKDVIFGSSYDQGAWATVGIQGDGATGLQYSHHAPALTEDLAICFAYGGAAPNCIVDVPWLSVTPSAGELAADSQTTVDLAFDAGVAAVTQPGDYLARVRINMQGFARTAQATVALRVQPPATWGNVHGIVRSLGACDVNPAPLHKALVMITGANGFNQSLVTNADGSYSLWMDVVHGPFTVAAVMPDHALQTASEVVVPVSGSAQRDFDLRRLQSCITTTTTVLTVTLTPGASATRTFVLRNSGVLSGQFILRESTLSQDQAATPGSAPPGAPPGGGHFAAPLFQVEGARILQRTAQGLSLPARQAARQLDAGTILRTWPATANNIPWGIAYTAAATVWVGDGWGANHMDAYQTDGTVTGLSFPYTWNPSFGPADFTYNGNTGKLWLMGVDLPSCIHEVDPATGVTGVKICPPWSMSERGLAFDPDTDTYFGGSWNDGLLHRFDATGAILETFATNLAIAGLAYNSSTGHLFVMENFDPNLIQVLDVANQYQVIGSFSIDGFSAYGGAGLEIDCNGALWAVDQRAGLVYQVDSGESASWCYTDLPWMTPAPASGVIAPAGEQIISVEFTAAAPVGEHRVVLHVVQDNPALQTIDIPVTLQVALPTVQFAAENYSAELNDSQVLIDVRLSKPAMQPVTVDYATGDDVRVARSVGRLTFPPGETSKMIALPLLVHAPSGVVPLTLRNPINAALGAPATAFLTLRGDDLRGFPHELWASPQAPHTGTPMTIGAIVHRLMGINAHDVTVRFYLGAPGGSGLLLGDGVVTMLSGSGSGASSTVTWTPTAPGVYDLFAVFDPDNLLAESNETNNVLHRLITVLEAQGDAQPPSVTALAIADGASQTASRAVTLTVAAADAGEPASGATHIYVVEYAVDQALRTWVPVQNSAGWLPLDAQASGLFAWQLTATPGLKFLAVWAADAAGNIASAPRRVAINYLPASVTLAAESTTLLRYNLNAGDHLRVQLTPASGDPDLYLWGPDAMTLPRPPWISDAAGSAVESLAVTAPVAGAYQVEVYGFAAATFALDAEVIPAAPGAVDSVSDGVRSAKPIHIGPLVWPTHDPADAYGLNPPRAAERPHFYLPLLERRR